MGASPVLVDDKLLMICDQDLAAFLIAVDRNTGKPVWKAERPEMVHSFSTPIVYRGSSGFTGLIVPGSYQMTSYNVANGDMVWRVQGLTYQVKSVPVVGGDTLYFNGWAPGGEPSERIELPPFEEAVKLFDKDGDGKISKEELPKKWHPGSWDRLVRRQGLAVLQHVADIQELDDSHQAGWPRRRDRIARAVAIRQVAA
jgi:hypothetical protein